MGRVLVCNDRQFGRHVALKELRPGSADSPALIERFAVEALVTGNLEHPGVPAVYERGHREDGAPFYTMRLVRGDTLAARIASCAGVRERLALLPAIVRLSHTLAFAHEHGVVHRDVKPENVLLGKHGETVLLDWGISKVRGGASEGADAVAAAVGSESHARTATLAGTLLGTPAYMAPEQATGRVDAVDERTDVFAVGAVLYHVLSGRAPYRGSDTAALVMQAIQASPEPLERLSPDVPGALVAIVRRAMARDPAERYQSAADLAQALEDFTADAVAAGDSRAVRLFAGGASLFAVGLLGLLSVVTVAMFPVSMQANPTSALFGIMAVLGCALSVIEWRTRGRYRLSPLAFGFALATVLMGACLTMIGTSNTFTVAGTRALEDPLRFRKIVALGVAEAVGPFTVSAILTAFQVMLWSAARRSAASAQTR